MHIVADGRDPKPETAAGGTPAGTLTSPLASPALWFERHDVDHWRDFRPPPTTAHAGDDRLSAAGPRVDAALMTPGSAILLASSVPVVLRGLADPEGLRDLWDFYTQPKFLSSPDAFFTPPPTDVVPVVGRCRSTPFRPGDGTVSELVFSSPYEPAHSSLRDDYFRNSANMLAHARYWRHRSGPRRTVVCVHGYMAANHVINTELFKVRWLYERGLDVVLYSLPYHGPRAIVDGYGFPSFDLARMAEGWGHAISDFRVILNWLLAAGAPGVGVMGVSLGGYFSALAAAVEERLDFAVPIIPATSLADVCAEWWPASALLARLLARMGWTLDDARLRAACHTPLQFAPRLPRERLLIVGANGDNLTRPYQARMLWEHWGGPEIHWYAGSHVLQARRGTYLRQLGRFLAGIGAFTPRGIHSPAGTEGSRPRSSNL